MSERAPSPIADPAPPKRGRYPQTALALVGAIIGCLGIVAFLVLVVVRPDGATRPAVDWHAVADQVSIEHGSGILDPQLPEGWSGNYARLGSLGETTTWEIGFLSPTEGYVGLVQALLEPGVPLVLPEAITVESTGQVRIGGLDWTVYDHRTGDPFGNYAINYVTELPGSLVILHGAADDADFETVATAIAEQVR